MSKKGIALFLAFLMLFSIFTPQMTTYAATYTLNDCTVLDDSEEVKNYTSYVDYLDEAAIPDSKVITVTGENGEKLQLQGKVAKKEVISNGEWLNTQITITFDHYDSGEYVWQGETIYNSSNPYRPRETSYHHLTIFL